MIRFALVLLVLLPANVALAQRPYRTPQQIRHDDELSSELRDQERRREEHCAQVGQAECAREQREGQREWDDAVRAGEAQHCREIGWPACRAEQAAAAAEGRWETWLPIAATILLIAALFWVTRRSTGQVRPKIAAPIPEEPRGDVASLDVAIPIDAARALRAELDRIHATTPVAIDALPALARAIAETSTSWSAVCPRHWPATTSDAAWTRWRGLLDEIKARPDLEVPPPPPQIGDGYRGGPPAAPPPSFALVSISVFSKKEIPEVSGDPTARALAMLEQMRALAVYEVDSVQLTWLPDDAGETQTMRELQIREPHLVSLT